MKEGKSKEKNLLQGMNEMKGEKMNIFENIPLSHNLKVVSETDILEVEKRIIDEQEDMAKDVLISSELLKIRASVVQGMIEALKILNLLEDDIPTLERNQGVIGKKIVEWEKREIKF